MEKFLGFAIKEALEADGWKVSYNSDGWSFHKLVVGFAEPGSFSNGNRLIVLTLDASGRWLARLDGWGKVEKDVDLRRYENAKSAIDFVLKAK